jgi:hypothetical protein
MDLRHLVLRATFRRIHVVEDTVEIEICDDNMVEFRGVFRRTQSFLHSRSSPYRVW